MSKQDTFKGIISGIYGAYYTIYPLDPFFDDRQEFLSASGQKEVLARLRGRIRIGVGSAAAGRKRPSEAESWEEQYRLEQMKSRHPVIPGDTALFTLERTGDSGKTEALIQEILPRSHTIIRSVDFTEHALGTNLSRALLIVSISEPSPKMNFIDRFLASACFGNVEAHIVFTKTDLIQNLSGPERDYTDYLMNIYKELGYSVYQISDRQDLNQNQDFIRLKKITSEGITLFTGSSGAGKSTLLNSLAGTSLQRTSEVSQASGKGRHTTVNSVLIARENGAFFYIDTPGVKEWGIQHLNRNDILSAYPETESAMGECRFSNCDHSEGVMGCAVQAAISDMDPDRRSSLESLLGSLKYTERIRTGDYIKPTGRFRNKN